MSSFEVTAEGLSGAGALVAASDTELAAGRSSVKGSGDALTGTPASVNYGLLVGNVDTLVTGTHTAVASPAEARREAAAAYALADNSAAHNLTVKGHRDERPRLAVRVPVWIVGFSVLDRRTAQHRRPVRGPHGLWIQHSARRPRRHPGRGYRDADDGR